MEEESLQTGSLPWHWTIYRRGTVTESGWTLYLPWASYIWIRIVHMTGAAANIHKAKSTLGLRQQITYIHSRRLVVLWRKAKGNGFERLIDRITLLHFCFKMRLTYSIGWRCWAINPSPADRPWQRLPGQWWGGSRWLGPPLWNVLLFFCFLCVILTDWRGWNILSPIRFDKQRKD